MVYGLENSQHKHKYLQPNSVIFFTNLEVITFKFYEPGCESETKLWKWNQPRQV